MIMRSVCLRITLERLSVWVERFEALKVLQLDDIQSQFSLNVFDQKYCFAIYASRASFVNRSLLSWLE